MAKRAYMIPLRNDLSGMGLYVYDLVPNGSQKNNNLDGVGQSHYLKHNFDAEADDQVVNAAEGLVSGSATTDTISAIAAADVVAPGGNDSSLTQATDFGLKAYLRDRVVADPGGAADTLSQGELDNIYDSIVALVLNTGAEINVILVAEAGAGTELTSAGGSDSFGTVEEVVRILSGEVYRVRDNTVVADAAGAFMDLATRQSRVTNSIFADPVYAQGDFLSSDEVGYRAVPELALTEAVRLSANGGVLFGFGPDNPNGGITVLNPNFTYTGGTPTAIRPLAVNPFNGTTLPATGLGPAVAVFDTDGNRID
jgi:hypothetical protein